MLSTECLKYEGNSSYCKNCPVAEAGYCEAFILFLRNLHNKLVKLSQRPEGCLLEEHHDILAETLEAIEESLPLFNGRSSFSTWAWSIYLNKHHDWLRKTFQPTLQKVALGDIAAQLNCLILCGKARLKQHVTRCRMMENSRLKGAKGSTQDPRTLFFVHTPNPDLNGWIRRIPEINLVLCGIEKPGPELVETGETNNAVLMWARDSPEEAMERGCATLKGNRRLLSLYREGPDEDGSIEIQDQDAWRQCSQEELHRDIVRCYKKIIREGEHERCAQLVYKEYKLKRYKLYYDQDALHKKSDNVKLSMIYQELAEVYGKSFAAMKRDILRCNRKIRPLLQQCLKDYRM